MLHPAASLLLGASLVAATAGEPPRLNVEKTCDSSSRAGSGGNDRAKEGCLRSEREARDDLGRRWANFSAEAKRQCTEETRIGGDFPSYVELLTCLELATGQFPARGGADQGGAGTAAEPGAGRARGRAQ
jgi:hypothetical protein